MFAVDHEGIVPDLMMIAKGIASGLPLGAMVAAATLSTWERGSHGNTFGGNPIACEAALATLSLLQGGLIQNAAQMGDHLLERLQSLKNVYPMIGDVRGKGLMVGVELVLDHESKRPASPQRDQIVQGCFNKGLLLLGCGQSVVRFVPPLIITREDADTALEIFEDVLRSIPL
jgi:4-aminobutyrate aminotransferase